MILIKITFKFVRNTASIKNFWLIRSIQGSWNIKNWALNEIKHSLLKNVLKQFLQRSKDYHYWSLLIVDFWRNSLGRQNHDIRKRDADRNSGVINPSRSNEPLLVGLPQTGEEVSMGRVVEQDALETKWQRSKLTRQMQVNISWLEP